MRAPLGAETYGVTVVPQVTTGQLRSIRPDEFGFALEGTHRWLLLLSELVSWGKGTMAEPSRAWSNSMARSRAEKHLTAWVSPSMQENT